MQLRTIILIAMAGLVVAALALGTRRAKIVREPSVGQQPMVTRRLLPMANSAQTIEIKNAKASTTAPYLLKDLSCVVRNNTDKAITAIVPTWKVTTQMEDEETSSTELQTTDFFVDAECSARRRKVNYSGARMSNKIQSLAERGVSSARKINSPDHLAA